MGEIRLATLLIVGVLLAACSAHRDSPATSTQTPAPLRASLVVVATQDGHLIRRDMGVRPSTARVSSIVDDGTDGWWVGGNYSSIGGVRCARLAHLLQDLTVDTRSCGLGKAFGGVEALIRSRNTLFVAGYGRRPLAAVDTAKFRILPWDPRADDEVGGIALRGTTLYAAGWFTAIGGSARFSLGAVNIRTARATSWNPRPNANIHGDSADQIRIIDDTIYVAGGFSRIGGKHCTIYAALDARRGKLRQCPDYGMPVADKTNIYAGDGRLIAFDRRTGRPNPLWKPPPRANSATRGAYAASSGRVYATYSTTLVALDSNNGHQLQWGPLRFSQRNLIEAVCVGSRYTLVGSDPTY